MINTNFRQGAFKKYDELVIIDPYDPSDWKIVFLCENYGVNRDIKVISYQNIREYKVEVTTIDTNFIDLFYKVYKIIKEYENDWRTIYITIFKKR